jgi:primosomal protein N' (replication factor Y)
MSDYLKIAISGPLRKSFTYKLPANTLIPLLGQRIIVPFGNKNKVGFYIGKSKKDKRFKIKPIVKPLDNISYFTPELFKFCNWIADYYFANPADCMLAALPSSLKKNQTASFQWNKYLPEKYNSELEIFFKPDKKLTGSTLKDIEKIKKGLLSELLNENIISEKWNIAADKSKPQLMGYKINNDKLWDGYFRESKFKPNKFENYLSRKELLVNGWSSYQIKKALDNNIIKSVYKDKQTTFGYISPRENIDKIKLNNQQKDIVEDFSSKINKGFNVSLLHGVTGSGKTIVYCHICQEIINQNKTALVLTPEIALTSTTLAYFRGFFGDTVTVIHSAMSESERLESWHGIRSGKYKIVLGPRSAIFAPLSNLGLIIIDEEHDSSYKQDDPAPRFHGRDAGIMRGKINNIPVLLGSASPSFESYNNAITGRYHLYQLTARPGNAVLPDVKIVDMRSDRLKGDLPFFSYTLKKSIETRLEKNQQVILFLNRRGYSTQLKCSTCGHVPHCPNCIVNLTYHKSGKKLTCHYCGYIDTKYNQCFKCNSVDFLYLGVGTQKVEQNIPRLFEKARPIRLDSDSTDGRNKTYDILKSFSDEKFNLLLGTQMVTKGLDMPNVTLVGVLSADSALDLPDFRAKEKAFSKLLQVSGRSGRSNLKGEVLIQTFCPDHQVIEDASKQDFLSFFKREIDSRKSLNYPPFSRIVNFIFSSTNEKKAETEALNFKNKLLEKSKKYNINISVLGPAPCPMYFLRGKYRRHFFVKTRQVIKLIEMLTHWENSQPNFKINSNVRLNIDVDPDDML